MQIKQAAAQCGLTEKAIRLYEEKGLLNNLMAGTTLGVASQGARVGPVSG